MKVYEAKTYWSLEIVEHELLRETDKCVWLDRRGREDRRLKISDGSRFFPTWEEAHDHVVRAAELKLETASHQLTQAERALIDVMNMRAPEKAA